MIELHSAVTVIMIKNDLHPKPEMFHSFQYLLADGHPRTARVLLLLVVPGHLVFMYTISYLKAGHTSLTPIFVVTYLLAAFLQVSA